MPQTDPFSPPSPSARPARITITPERCSGQPCLSGLRIRVRDVLDLLASGADRAEILADYPLLDDADITAALEYATHLLEHAVESAL
jgi:uncharacterized protein (DUF433 family)